MTCNEFTVWESQAPHTELMAALLGPATMPPTSWLPGNAESLFEVLGSSRPQFLQSLRRLRDAIAAVEGSLESGKPPTLR